jgi:hypothetical protein
LRADKGDLRNDRSSLRSGDQGGRRADWQDQRSLRNTGHPVAGQRVEGAKSGITASTLANDATENSKKAQTKQTVHKAWYHIWW